MILLIKAEMPGLVVFESIGNEYYWGDYAGIKVLIMKENGYVNATKMCNDENKSFRYWLKSQETKDLLDGIERSGNRISDLMIKNMVGSNEFRGTYVHLDLVPHIAYWVSVSFAIKVGKIVNEYYLREAKAELQKKDEHIEELKSLIKNLQKDTKSVLDNNKCMGIQIFDLIDNVSKLSLENKITHEKLDNVQETLDIVVEDRVVRPEDESTMNTIVIYENEKKSNKFYVFRVQKRGFKVALKRYLNKYPNAVKFDEIEYNPNAINYYNRFKKEYKNEINAYYNSFELIGITKNTLREFIAKVNNEKYQIENCK
jgi:hypothetical protein